MILQNDGYGISIKLNDVIIRYDKIYRFFDIFRMTDGFAVTSNKLLSHVKPFDLMVDLDTLINIIMTSDPKYFTTEDPFMRTFPSLLDIGIIGEPCNSASTCKVDCYQKRGSAYGKNIDLDDYKSIIDQVKGHCFSVALGGSGNPTQHKDFIEIIKYSRENNVIPNYTVSGYGLTEEHVKATKEYCGAVAVSWERETYWRDRAIQMFLDAGIKTNIHFVLGKDTIGEAIAQIKYSAGSTDTMVFKPFPEGIHAVLFLSYKNVGLGNKDNLLTADDPRVKKFFDLVDTVKPKFKFGFDACSVAGLINNTKNINLDSVVPCDASRMSAYIDSSMDMMPCSFDNQGKKWAINLKNDTFIESWYSFEFNSYRTMLNSCPKCDKWTNCFGGCHIERDITICNLPEREYND